MSDSTPTGTIVEVGEPDTGTEPVAGQPEPKSAAGGEPSSGVEPSGEIGPEHKSYKEIQSAYSRSREEIKETQQKLKDIELMFAPYGGLDQAKELAKFLVNDQEFPKWLQNRIQPQSPENDIYRQLGIDPEENPEGAQAVKSIMTIADQIAEQKLGNLKQEFAKREVEAKKKEVAGLMDKLRSDPDFSDIDDYRDIMANLSEQLAPEKRMNPTIKDLQSLYFMALNESGKMEAYAEKVYQKRLEAKKARSQEKPQSPKGNSGKKQYNSIREAFADAKYSLGL